MKLVPMSKFHEIEPSVTYRYLMHLKFSQDENGCRKYGVFKQAKPGSKIFVDVDAFEKWLSREHKKLA